MDTPNEILWLMIRKKTEQIKLMRYPFILLPRGVLESSGERPREVELEAKRWGERTVFPGMNDKMDQELRIAILQKAINWRVYTRGHRRAKLGDRHGSSAPSSNNGSNTLHYKHHDRTEEKYMKISSFVQRNANQPNKKYQT